MLRSINCAIGLCKRRVSFGFRIGYKVREVLNDLTRMCYKWCDKGYCKWCDKGYEEMISETIREWL